MMCKVVRPKARWVLQGDVTREKRSELTILTFFDKTSSICEWYWIGNFLTNRIEDANILHIIKAHHADYLIFLYFNARVSISFLLLKMEKDAKDQ